LDRSNITAPRVINVDNNPAYIGAVPDWKQEMLLAEQCQQRPSQYMNNILKQDHRFFRAATLG